MPSFRCRILCLLFICFLWNRVDAQQEEGIASFYHDRFHGRRTASGEVYDRNELTAAHRYLPFGTYVRVTNLANGKRVVVRIDDRGPFRRGWIIDLSRKAAGQLDFIGRGITRVRIEGVPGPQDYSCLEPLPAAVPFIDRPELYPAYPSAFPAKPVRPRKAPRKHFPRIFSFFSK